MTPQPLSAWYPSPVDYGTDPDSIDPANLPTGWTPQGAALIGGAVTRSPLEQAQFNLGLQESANKAQAQTQGQQFFQGVQGLPADDQGTGMDYLLSQNPMAASLPGVQRYLQERRTARQASIYGQRYAPLAPEGVRFLANLYSADPTDPDALAAINQQAIDHPEWVDHPNIAQPFERFMQRAQQIRQQAALRPSPRSQSRDVAVQLASSGIDPTTIDQMRDPDTGELDPVQAAYAMSRARQLDRIPTQDKQQLIQLDRDLLSPPDAAKQTAWENAHPGQTFPGTADAWSEGFQRARIEAAQKRSVMRQALGFPSDGAPAMSSGVPPTINSSSQYAALPVGTAYVDSVGNHRVKR